MKLLVLYEKVILLIDKMKKELEQAKTKKNKVLMFSGSLSLYFLEGMRIFIRFLCLLFGDSAENFLIFSKLGKESVIFCNNSFCGYIKSRGRCSKQDIDSTLTHFYIRILTDLTKSLII